MIDISNIQYKSLYFSNEKCADSLRLAKRLEMSMTQIDHLLKETQRFESKAKIYIDQILSQYGFERLFNYELSVAKSIRMLVESNIRDLFSCEFTINPLLQIVNSAYIYSIENGIDVIAQPKNTQYGFLIKTIAINKPVVEEYPIIGPVKFLSRFRKGNETFTIEKIQNNKSLEDRKKIEWRLRRMIWRQLLVPQEIVL